MGCWPIFSHEEPCRPVGSNCINLLVAQGQTMSVYVQEERVKKQSQTRNLSQGEIRRELHFVSKPIYIPAGQWPSDWATRKFMQLEPMPLLCGTPYNKPQTGRGAVLR